MNKTDKEVLELCKAWFNGEKKQAYKWKCFSWQ